MSDAIRRPKLEILTVTPSGSHADSASTRDRAADAVQGFEAVFRSEYTQVVRMAYLLLGATGEAEEVTQEAFATLLQRWDRVDNPPGFVRTAVLNRCRDLGRRRSVRRRALQRLKPPEEPTLPDGAANMEVTEALASLEFALREVVVLRYYLDHTVDQIAALTDVPSGTVKSRLHRAIAQLGDRLGD